MKKLSVLTISLFFILSIPYLLNAMTINLQIDGSDELKNQKDAISKTIETRCLAKGIDITKYNNLNIHINKFGDTYSFDAILDSTPPKAFHKDMKSSSDLTSTIDEMIPSIFSITKTPVQTSSAPAAVKDIRLDFNATSIIIFKNDVYVSGGNTIYLIKDGKPTPWWSYKGPGPVLRIWPYNDTIIALIKYNGGYRKDVFLSHQIKDGATINTWTGVVLPMGDGLIRTDIAMPPDITEETNRWASTQVQEGTPDLLPSGMDPLASIRAEIMPWSPGKEIITFSKNNGQMYVYSKDMKNPKQSSKGFWDKTKGYFAGTDKKALWASDVQFSRLPLYLQYIYIERSSNTAEDAESREEEVDYFMPPRIMVDSDHMITIDNNQGLWSMLDKATVYKSCQIRIYTWNGNDFTETVPLRSTLGYCSDFTVLDGKILSLIVTDEGTLLRTVSLEDNVI